MHRLRPKQLALCNFDPLTALSISSYSRMVVEVYSLVSSASSAALLTFTQLSPDHRTLFIHKQSQLPGEHTAWRPQVSAHMTNHTYTFLGPTRYPLLLLGREGARVGKGFAQEHIVNNKFRPACDRTGDVSLASRARCTIN